MRLPGRAWVALGLYVTLALLAGFTMAPSVIIGARVVDPRWAVWILLGGMAAKTLIHVAKLGRRD
jgi:hypothetical protein